MKSCANCKMCYVSITDESYKCLVNSRGVIKGMFFLGRHVCDDHIDGVTNLSK